MSMKNLRRRYSDVTPNQLELMAAKELFERGTKSRAFYQGMASKMLSGLTARIKESPSQRPELDLTSLYEEYHPAASTPASNALRSHAGVSKIYFRPGSFHFGSYVMASTPPPRPFRSDCGVQVTIRLWRTSANCRRVWCATAAI